MESGEEEGGVAEKGIENRGGGGGGEYVRTLVKGN